MKKYIAADQIRPTFWCFTNVRLVFGAGACSPLSRVGDDFYTCPHMFL